MTKAKTTAAEAETPPIGTTVDGQDLNAPSGPGASPEPANDPDGNSPSSQTPGAESADQTPPPPTEEQETARREAEAMLAAQAEADAAAAAEAERLAQEAAAAAEAERLAQEAAAAAEAERLAQEAAAAAEAPALDLNTLTVLAVQIDMLNTTGHRLGLVDELIGLYGADIADRDDEGVTVTMQGISIEPADSMENALNNWANAARRAVMGATA